MFERYTERARRVLFFGRYEASQLGSLSIEPEHLLLGLLREGKGLSARIFARYHVSLETIRKEVEDHVVFREKISTSVEIPFSHSARRVLEFAAQEADGLQTDYIGTEHLLLAILREGTSPAAMILRDKGMRLDTARANVVELRHQPPLADGRVDIAPEHGQDVPRALGGRTLPHYLPSRTVHITYSTCSPQEEAWIQHAGQTWRAFGYTLRQIVAHAWAVEERAITLEVRDLYEHTRYNFTVVLPHAESMDVIPQLLQEAVQRDFEVEVVPEGESAGVVVRGVR